MLKKLPSWLFPLVLSVLLSVNFFWSRPLVPGFDSPFYLVEIRNFSHGLPNPFTYVYADRYLTVAFPGLLAMIFGFDPVTSYRVSATAVYAGISVALYFLFLHITQKNMAAASLSSALIVSPLLLSYSSMLFANFTGFLVLFTFFAVETGKSFKYKYLLLTFIFLLIFLVHNFSSVSFSLILIVYYVLKYLFSRSVKIGGTAVFILTVLALLAVFNLYKLPVLMALLARFQPAVIGDETSRIISTGRDNMGKYWLYIFPLFLVISLISSYKEIVFQKNKFLFPLAILLPSLLFTFQPVYHLNFLPERFVSLVCLSSFFFYAAVISLPKFKKYLIPLAVMPLLLNYISADNLILDKGYRNISPVEISVYRSITPFINTQGIVFISSDHYYWSRYFLEKIQVFSGDHFISCGIITTPGSYGTTSFTVARLLAETDPVAANTYVSVLKSTYPGVPLYVLADTGLACSSRTVLPHLNTVRQLYHDGNWYLYEII